MVHKNGFLFGGEVCVSVYVSVCGNCVGFYIWFLFLYKNCSEWHSHEWKGNTVITYLLFFQLKGETKLCQFSTAFLVKLHFWHKWKELDDSSEGWAPGSGGRCFKSRNHWLTFFFYLRNPMWDRFARSRTCCNVNMQLNLIASHVVHVRITSQQMLVRNWNCT